MQALIIAVWRLHFVPWQRLKRHAVRLPPYQPLSPTPLCFSSLKCMLRRCPPSLSPCPAFSSAPFLLCYLPPPVTTLLFSLVCVTPCPLLSSEIIAPGSSIPGLVVLSFFRSSDRAIPVVSAFSVVFCSHDFLFFCLVWCFYVLRRSSCRGLSSWCLPLSSARMLSFTLPLPALYLFLLFRPSSGRTR